MSVTVILSMMCRVFHRACCELAKAGYEVHLLAQGKGTKAYEEKGVIIHPLPNRKVDGSDTRAHLAWHN